jgi:anti-sigma regulatory factor (Ser/Thr protein kinase)
MEVKVPADAPTSVRVSVTDLSEIGRARRAAQAVATEMGLGADLTANIGLIATELATNLVRHAHDGAVLVRAIDDIARRGVEVLAVDKGPGIRDVTRAMHDGYSTAGTRGTGLGAVRRLASEFDVYSMVDSGTALVARVWAPSPPAPHATAPVAKRYAVGAVCVPIPGETECGDAWLVEQSAATVRIAVVDGLGHGHEAARAAAEALRAVRAAGDAAPADIVQAAHGPLRATRGAAIAIARIEAQASTVHFAGIGNIAATIVGPASTRSMASHSGILGHQLRQVREFSYDWPAAGYLVLHTDGLSARWRPDAYPGLIGHDPALVAGVLHRDFARPRDDATILVVRDAAR